jgi:hypothetical protein
MAYRLHLLAKHFIVYEPEHDYVRLHLTIKKIKNTQMKKKTLFWTAIATTAMGITVYYLRKKKVEKREAEEERRNYMANVSQRRPYSFGEFTL